MITAKLISIIMPYFNTKAEYLTEAIESVIAQEQINPDDMEHIIIDDYSDQQYIDSLKKCLDERKRQEYGIDIIVDRIIDEKGPGNARNRGLT